MFLRLLRVLCLVGNKRADIARVIPCKNNFCTKFAHRFYFCGLQKLNTLNLRLFHPPLNPCNHFPTVLIKTNWYTISYKFKDCSSLTAITIPNSVTSLRQYCFYGCSSLTSIIVPNSVASIAYSCFAGASYKIYSYPRNSETLKFQYGERVGVYGAPIYTLQNTGRTQTKLKIKVVPRTDIAYIPAKNEGEYSAIEVKAYLTGEGTITISNPSQDEGVFSGLVPNSPYRLGARVKYSDGYEMSLQYDKDITTLGTNPKISAAASSPTAVKSTGRFTLTIVR